MTLKRITLGGAVPTLIECTGNVEMIAPAGQFKALVAKLIGLPREILKLEIGPLTSEQCNGTRHGLLLMNKRRDDESGRPECARFFTCGQTVLSCARVNGLREPFTRSEEERGILKVTIERTMP